MEEHSRFRKAILEEKEIHEQVLREMDQQSHETFEYRNMTDIMGKILQTNKREPRGDKSAKNQLIRKYKDEIRKIKKRNRKSIRI